MTAEEQAYQWIKKAAQTEKERTGRRLTELTDEELEALAQEVLSG